MWGIEKSRLEPSLFCRELLLASAFASMSWMVLTRFSCCPTISKRRTNFALMWCIQSYPVKISWQDPTLMLNSSATSRTVKQRFPWRLSKPGVFTDWCSALFEMLKPLVALYMTPPFLSVSLLQQFNVSTNVLQSLKQNSTHTHVVPQPVS